MPRNTYGFHSGYTCFASASPPMRANPAGAVASGDTNVLPPTTTSWKNRITSSARIAAAHPAPSTRAARAGFGATGFTTVFATLLRSVIGLPGGSRHLCEPALHHFDHAAGERAPVVCR